MVGGLASEATEDEDEGDPRATNLVTPPSVDNSSISLLIFGPKYERRVALSFVGRTLSFARCALSLSFCRIG